MARVFGYPPRKIRQLSTQKRTSILAVKPATTGSGWPSDLRSYQRTDVTPNQHAQIKDILALPNMHIHVYFAVSTMDDRIVQRGPSGLEAAL